MLNRTFWLLALCLSSLFASATDVLRLKDDAAITGKILAEKPDQVVIDLGYTVLIVPRAQILNLSSRPATDSLPAASAVTPSSSALAALTARPATAPEVTGPPHQDEVRPGQSLDLSRPAASKKSALFQDGDRAKPDRTVRDLVNVLGEAVVQVRTPSGLGSGFIINEEGYLITNFHVIESETQISVEVYHQKDGQLDRRTYKQVKIVAMNKHADLALLKIEDKDAPRFASVALGDSEELGVGERVFAIGSPLGLERTVTEGIVSTKTRPMQGELYLQTTTQINPGNSGGPLFNLRGEVVGVTNMKIAFGEGIGFAIPAYAVKFFLNHRDAFAYDTDNPSSPYRYLEPPSRVSKIVPQP